MRVTPEILQDEFTGLEVKVEKSENPSCIGIRGRVIDETRNTLILLHNNRKKVIPKETSIFHFMLSGGTVVRIDGKAIIGRPEDRLKKKFKRRW